MKKILLLTILSTNVLASEPRKDPFEDQNLTCIVTSDNKRYEDVFLIEVREKGYSHLSYKRIHLGKSEYGPFEGVRGCYHGIQVKDKYRPERLEIECRDDGQEGSISIDPKTLTGEIYFYMPQIGYGERTELSIECK